MEADEATLLSVLRLLRSDTYRGRIVSKVKDPLVRSYWVEAFETWDVRFQEQVTAPISNKLDACLSHPAIRHIISQPRNPDRHPKNDGRAPHPHRQLEQGQRRRTPLPAVRCPDGFGDHERGVLRVVISRRINDSRSISCVDEFNSVITTDITTILSEARKYRLRLTLASQYLSQIPDDILAAVFGNAGTYISFRLGIGDATEMARQFGIEDENAFLDLQTLERGYGRWSTAIRAAPDTSTCCRRPCRFMAVPRQLVHNSNVRFARSAEKSKPTSERLFAAVVVSLTLASVAF